MATEAARQWSPQTAGDNRLPRPPRPMYPFFLAHYFQGWSFYEEKTADGEYRSEFLPQLSEAKHQPGVNGVADPPEVGMPPSTAGMVAGILAKGGTIIRPDDARLGEFRGFIQFYECRGGEKAFCYRWQTPKVMANGVLRWDTDEAKHRNFLRHCRDHALVNPMTAEAWEAIEARQVQLIEGLPGRYHHASAILLKEKHDAANERLLRMRAAWAAYVETLDVPEPVTAQPSGSMDAPQPQGVSSADLGLPAAVPRAVTKPRLSAAAKAASEATE